MYPVGDAVEAALCGGHREESGDKPYQPSSMSTTVRPYRFLTRRGVSGRISWVTSVSKNSSVILRSRRFVRKPERAAASVPIGAVVLYTTSVSSELSLFAERYFVPMKFR